MDYSPENAAIILGLAEKCLKSDQSDNLKLRDLWNTLLHARTHVLASGARAAIGNKVLGGPFKGMLLGSEALAVAAETPLMLGSYEHELHPVIESIIAGGYKRILNIGSSIGYYAVGLARRMPDAIIEAFDIDETARKNCARFVAVNDMGGQVLISGEFRGDDFARYTGAKTLALVDIEGEEINLLDPERYPALRQIDVVVELHDVIEPGISKKLCERFAPTHSIELIENRNVFPDITGLLPPGAQLTSFDHFLIGWEGRGGATPWGIFRAKP